MRGDQRPFQQRVAVAAHPARPVECQVCRRDGRSHHEERRHPQQIGRGHAALLPPLPDQQCRRQRDHHRLGQQAGGVQCQRRQVAPGARRLGETHPRQRRRQVEQAGEHVLELDYPGHRLDVHGMHREHRRHHPGARYRQAPQELPHQERVGQVQQHVDHVEPGRATKAPQLVLQPEQGVDQRPVMPLGLDFRRREPDLPQAGSLAHRGGGGHHQVVPDEVAPQHRRQVAHQHQQAQRQRRQPWPRTHHVPHSSCRLRRGRFPGGCAPRAARVSSRARGCGRCCTARLLVFARFALGANSRLPDRSAAPLGGIRSALAQPLLATRLAERPVGVEKIVDQHRRYDRQSLQPHRRHPRQQQRQQQKRAVAHR